MSVRILSRALDTPGLSLIERVVLIYLADAGNRRAYSPKWVQARCEISEEDELEAVYGLYEKGLIVLLRQPYTYPQYILFPTEEDQELAEKLDSNPPWRPAIPLSVRRAVFDRDGHLCGYCGTRKGPFHLDHVVPISRGGANSEDNLMVACRACNIRKRDRTPEEWLS